MLGSKVSTTPLRRRRGNSDTQPPELPAGPEPEFVISRPGFTSRSDANVLELQEEDGGFEIRRLGADYANEYLDNLTHLQWFQELLAKGSADDYRDGYVYGCLAYELICRWYPGMTPERLQLLRDRLQITTGAAVASTTPNASGNANSSTPRPSTEGTTFGHNHDLAADSNTSEDEERPQGLELRVKQWGESRYKRLCRLAEMQVREEEQEINAALEETFNRITRHNDNKVGVRNPAS
jgi:hypothetical protein